MLRIFTKRESAPVASARLKLLLEHERAVIGQTDLVSVLKTEMLAVIDRHVPVRSNRVRIRADKNPQSSRIRVDIELPTGGDADLH